jgi:hypothetical protein
VGGLAGGEGGEGAVSPPAVGAGVLLLSLPPPPQAARVTPVAQIRNSARSRRRAREEEELSVEIMTTA